MLPNKEDQHDNLQLQTIRKNSDSLLQLVNELMDFRKAETGNLPLAVSNYNIVDFVRSIYSSFHEISISRNIDLQLIASSDNMEVYFDKGQLEKVLYNLLGNAFKFTQNGGNISLDIHENKSSVEVKVTDDGKGIAAENLDKLFDNYFQEADYGKQNTGYGIGLALSKSIVELHHGTLSVESETGKTGLPNRTCFSVTLLKSKSHFDESCIIKDNVVSKDTDHTGEMLTSIDYTSPINETGDRQTLLIVEDNEGIRDFIKDAFIKQYDIIESANGLNGWQQAIEAIPDIIISDIMMPEMDGLSLCHKLKTDVRTSHIPVVLLTAKSGASNHISGLQTGADVYLTKPFSIQILNLQIRNLLVLADRARNYLSNKAGLQPSEEKTGSLPENASSLETVNIRLNPIDEGFLNTVVSLVEEYMDDPDFTVAVLARKVAMSKPVLYKKIKAITGMSVNDFLKSVRLKKAAELLLEKRHTVYEVAFLVGYNDSRYFSREFTKQFGKKPSEYIEIHAKGI